MTLDLPTVSRIAEANNKIKDFKVPPTLGKDSLYVNWKKVIKIWEAFTSVPEKKRVTTIFMTLKWEARKAILNMDIDWKTGVYNSIAELDKRYLKDESSQAYEAYETFEKICKALRYEHIWVCWTIVF